MAKRFKGYDKTTYEFVDRVIIACPKCLKKAQVICPGFRAEKEKFELETKLTCVHCGFNKKINQTPKTKVDWMSKYKPFFVRYHLMNTYVDPYFLRHYG